MNIFHYFSSLNKLFNVPYAIELIIIFIECNYIHFITQFNVKFKYSLKKIYIYILYFFMI